MNAHLLLRDRAVVDVFDLALRFVARHWKKLARLTAIVVMPWFLVTWLVGETLGWGWAWALALFLSLFAQAPFTLLASRLVFEDTVPLGKVMRDAMGELPKLVALRFVQALLVGIAACVFVVPAFWAGSVLLFSTESLMLEKGTTGAAISRSNRLASSSAGDAIVAVLLLVLLEGAFVLLGELAGRSLLEDLLQVNAPASMFEAGGSPLALLGFWLFVPYHAVARFLAYINMRTRAEGWDVQTRFLAIASRDEREERDPLSRRAA